MSKIEINKLTNANVYMNGVNLLGSGSLTRYTI